MWWIHAKRNQEPMLEDRGARIVERRGVRNWILLCGFTWASDSLIHSLVFCIFQDVLLSTAHLHFLRGFCFYLRAWCAKRFNIPLWWFFDKNDIRLVGVQQFKSLCANDAHKFCQFNTFPVCQDGFEVKGWKERVYMWVTRWIYVAHEGIKPIIAAIFIFCSIMWRAGWPRLAMPLFTVQTRQILIFSGHLRQQQPCLHWLTNQNQF